MILYKSDNYIVCSFIEVNHGVGPLNGNKDFIVRYNIPSMQNNQKVYFSFHSSCSFSLPVSSYPYYSFLLSVSPPHFLCLFSPCPFSYFIAFLFPMLASS